MSFLIQWFPGLLLLMGILLVRHWRRSRERKPRLLAACFAAIVLLSWWPVAWLGLGSLEWWYPPRALPEGAAAEAEAIVVLSGGILPPREHRPITYLAADSYIRCRHAAWLHKHWRPLPILASGGAGGPAPADASLAAAMKEYLEGEGVPAELIWTEARSRTTHENALFSAEELRARGIRRIVLVTEAFHMLRAERCFRKQGLEVVPAPCGFRAAEFQWRLADFMVGHRAITWNEVVFHEWLGLLWYWLRGRV
jgi:uncharacterized SAM-binding protein YcdF (DUF218 family)